MGNSATPPASLTMMSPAAMSQQWMPYSKKESARPLATMHMFRAADPVNRTLQTEWELTYRSRAA